MDNFLKIDNITGKAYLNVLRACGDSEINLADISRKVNHQCLIAHN